MSTEAPRIYVVVRADIPWGNRAAQISHACQMSGAAHGCPDDCRVVVLEVNDEEGLLDAARSIEAQGAAVHLFHETEHPLGYNALCTEPVPSKLRLKLPLLR